MTRSRPVVRWTRDQIAEARLRGHALHAIAVWELCGKGDRIELTGHDPETSELVNLCLRVEMVGGEKRNRALEALRGILSDDNGPADE